MECSIKDIAPTQTALTDTSVLPVKEITLGSHSQQGNDPPFVSNNVQASLRPLTLECETSLSQLPFQWRMQDFEKGGSTLTQMHSQALPAL